MPDENGNDLPWEGPDMIDREAVRKQLRDEQLRQVQASKRKENGVVIIDLTPFAEEGDSDDMATDFKIMKRYQKAKRERNLEQAEAQADEGWTVHTEYHWSRKLNGKQLNYWPSRNKFQYEGKIYHGDVHGFIRKRERDNDGNTGS